MQRVDLPAFEKLMGEMAEVYGNRPISAVALGHWVDALSEHPFHTVDGVLRNWIRTQRKPPVIADITGICSSLLSDRVEQRAAADKAAFGEKLVFKGVTPYGKSVIAGMRELLKKPKVPSKDWARKIMENPNSTWEQRSFAAPVYATLEQREPGQDDEERAAA